MAGPHRLAANLPLLASRPTPWWWWPGMEGALPSVVGGHVACPVIAVPTSVGYGASFGGVAALLGMLNSCASNVTVVNIDAGFKGGYVAGLIAQERRPGAGCGQMPIEHDPASHDHRSTSAATADTRRPTPTRATFGLALIVGGSRGMTGAVALAGMAALRGGAGLVRLAVPERCLDVVAGFEPSYMTIAACRTTPRAASPLGARARSPSWPSRPRWSPWARAWGGATNLTALVAGLYRESAMPMVVDADAPERPGRRSPRSLHSPADRGSSRRIPASSPGCSAREACRPRSAKAAAVELAAQCGVVVVLKGHRTCITDGQRTLYVNTTGNPGMATGGSGDVLTGLITALWLPGACAAATPRGWASTCTAWPAIWRPTALGESRMIASDLVRFLPEALRQSEPPTADGAE